MILLGIFIFLNSVFLTIWLNYTMLLQIGPCHLAAAQRVDNLGHVFHLQRSCKSTTSQNEQATLIKYKSRNDLTRLDLPRRWAAVRRSVHVSSRAGELVSCRLQWLRTGCRFRRRARTPYPSNCSSHRADSRCRARRADCLTNKKMHIA